MTTRHSTDRFEIVRRLGTGGMGVVYEGRDRERGTPVALKTLHGVDPDALVRLKSEFRSLADVAHPNLVALYELVAQGDATFLVMELLHGVDLLTWVRGDGYRAPGAAMAMSPSTFDVGLVDEEPPPAPEDPVDTQQSPPQDTSRLRDAFRQLAEGISALHAADKLHRDLKPSNVLVEPDGRVAILDFGLLVDTGAARSGERAMGTVAYMAPEQASGHAVTPASDWYAFGVMLYEALTGAPPFRGSLAAVLRDKRLRDPTPPSVPVPADLESLCMRLLERDPRDRPGEAEVLATFGGRSAGAHHAVFTGRAGPLGALRGWLGGGSAVIAVRGPSGIGKTTLAREALRAVPHLRVRCHERESLPYKALDGLVDGVAAGLATDPGTALPEGTALLAQIFPALRKIPAVADLPLPDVAAPRERRTRAFRALGDLLVRHGPAVVLVDDAQWGDVDSAVVLADWLRAGLPLTVVLTLRPTPADAEFPRLLFASEAPSHTLDLTPLDDADAERLVRAVLPSADPATVAAMIREAGGSPLLLHELAVRGSGGRDLQGVVEDRLAELDERGRQLAQLVSLSTGPVAESVLERAVGDDTRRQLGLLGAGRLVIRSGGRVEPLHDGVRVAVATTVRAPEALHQLLAHGHEGEPDPDPEALATHWAAAGEPDRAAPFAVQAADRAYSGLAFEHAARWYATAESLGATGLGARRGRALALAGRGAEAAEVWLAIAPGRDDAVALRREAAEQLLAAGHVDRGLALLAQVFADVGLRLRPDGTCALVALVLGRARIAWRGMAWTSRGRADADTRRRLDALYAALTGLGPYAPLIAGDVSLVMLRMSLDSGDPHHVSLALMTYATQVAMGGRKPDIARAEGLLREAARAVEIAADPTLEAPLDYSRATVVYLAGRFDDAAELARSAARSYARIADPEGATDTTLAIDRSRLVRCWSLHWAGRIPELEAEFATLWRDGEQRHNVFLQTTLAADCAYTLGMVRDDPAWAEALLARAETLWSPSGTHFQHFNMGLARAQLALYRGDLVEARRITETTCRRFRVLTRLSDLTRALADGLLARVIGAICEAGLGSDADLRTLERLVVAHRSLDLPTAEPQARLLEGRLLALRGDAEGAAEALEAAAAGLRAADCRLPAATTEYRAARIRGDADAMERTDAALRALGARDPARLARAFSGGPPVG